MCVKNRNVGVLLILISFTSIGYFLVPANAATLSKCPDSILKPKIVATPSAATSALNSYVYKKLKNSIVSISPKSTLRSGSWWTAGWHKCYFDDKSIESGYTGFLPKRVESGYVTAVQLRKKLLSGGNTLFIRYFKQDGIWKVADSGTSP